jgi:DNA-binding response OmpR family regulator
MIQGNYGAGVVVNKGVSLATTTATTTGTTTVDAVSAGSERILVIEDDRAVQKALKRLFEAEGFTVDIAGNGATGLEMFRAAAPSVLVLDLSLPGTPGQDVCREISQAAPSLPIIVLSAKTEVMDKVLLLELGAHDYVTKPFSPRELLARVRTAMRRSQSLRTPLTETFRFGDVKVDFTKMELSREGNPVALTSQEFKVLKFMIQNAERVLSREELLNFVWGYRNYPSTRTVDNHILRLRQKLEKDPANPLHFRTVHSSGYKFVP